MRNDTLKTITLHDGTVAQVKESPDHGPGLWIDVSCLEYEDVVALLIKEAAEVESLKDEIQWQKERNQGNVAAWDLQRGVLVRTLRLWWDRWRDGEQNTSPPITETKAALTSATGEGDKRDGGRPGAASGASDSPPSSLASPERDVIADILEWAETNIAPLLVRELRDMIASKPEAPEGEEDEACPGCGGDPNDVYHTDDMWGCPGKCPYCWQAWEWVRPGKSQETCDCQSIIYRLQFSMQGDTSNEQGDASNDSAR